MLLRRNWQQTINGGSCAIFPCYMGVGKRWWFQNDVLSLFWENFGLVQNFFVYYFLVRYFKTNFRDLQSYVPFTGFKWCRFVLFSGLGYKRRMLKSERVLFAYIGDRHWINYKFFNYVTVCPSRRRNFIFFAKNKGSFNKDYNFFSSLRQQNVYKMKGFLDTRVRGRFLFVRRIKIRGIRTKLSRKQQLL